jgi:5'-nucleotidase
VRILVTNDDGVRAPGIAALARAVAAGGREVIVVAPLIDYSGAGAAVGPVHSRDGVDYETFDIDGLERVPTYGVDGPPALAVILACVGAFGPRPDLVVSGINHGANVGRSALHSGTVGAGLTAAHFGLRSLAVSIRWGPDPVPWETPATLAARLLPVLADAPPGTTLNLNVPDVGLDALRGLRHGHLGRGGTIRSAVHDTGDVRAHPHVSLPPGPSGTLRLDLNPPGHGPQVEPDTDEWLMRRGYGSLTPLVGVREADDNTGTVPRALEALYAVPGVGPGPPPPVDAPGEGDADRGGNEPGTGGPGGDGTATG